MAIPGAVFSELFHASGAIFEHGQARKTVADDDFSLGRSAAKFVDNHFAQYAAALGRLLADVGRLDRCAQQIELHDRNTAGDDVVEAVRHRIARNRGRNSLRAGIDDILHEFQLTVRRGPLLLRHFERNPEIIGGSLGAIDDLLDERVALGVGDEPDRDLVVGSGGGSEGAEIQEQESRTPDACLST